MRSEFGREGDVGFVLVLAALGTAAGVFGPLALLGGALLLLLFAFSDLLFLFFGSDHLFLRERIGGSLCDIHKRQGEAGDAGNGLGGKRGEEPV